MHSFYCLQRSRSMFAHLLAKTERRKGREKICNIDQKWEKLPNVWIVIDWVKQNPCEIWLDGFCYSKKIYTKQFQSSFINSITCFYLFSKVFFKFVTLCNEKIMSNFKRTKQSKQSFYIFYQQRTSILTSFDAVLFSIIVLKIAPRVLLLKLSVHWNCSWVYCGSEKAMQNQFTRHKLALHLILIKKWNGIHFFFLKHSELFLGVRNSFIKGPTIQTQKTLYNHLN